MKEVYTVRMTKFSDGEVIFTIQRNTMQFQIHAPIQEFEKLVELCLDTKKTVVEKDLISKTIEISNHPKELECKY